MEIKYKLSIMYFIRKQSVKLRLCILDEIMFVSYFCDMSYINCTASRDGIQRSLQSQDDIFQIVLCESISPIKHTLFQLNLHLNNVYHRVLLVMCMNMVHQ